MKQRVSRLIAKVIVFQIIFLLLHYSYEWFPNEVTRIFSATDESVYQHMKVAFFSYLLLVVAEWGIFRRSIGSFTPFLYGRIFTLVILPLILIVYFLTGPVFFVKIESIPLEILFANIVLLLTSFSAFLLEGHFEQIEPRGVVRLVLIFLLILTLIEFFVFTYRLPWFDIFAIPPGWG